MSIWPKDITEYKRWLRHEHGVRLSIHESRYNSVIPIIRDEVQKSDVWLTLNESLRVMDDEYNVKTDYQLLVNQPPLELHTKSFDSFLKKTFRKNILENDARKEPPEGGWLLPKDWFGRVNDIIRTLLVVKYLDGVTFAVDEIDLLFRSCEWPSKVKYEARTEGYYAAHLYTSVPVTIPRMDWDTETVDVSLELQITTQVQDVIRQLLHTHYEERRMVTPAEQPSWQWDYRSTEFSTNYLGHVLHYVEGMIVEIREKQEEEKS